MLDNKSWVQMLGNKSWVTNAGCPICPDFLRRLVALMHSMRLSLMKGAHVDLSSTAWQEIGVKPFFGLSGIMALDVQFSFSTTALAGGFAGFSLIPRKSRNIKDSVQKVD